MLLLLLPIAVIKAGGFAEMKAQLPTEYFAPLGIGGETIFTYVLIYTFGMLIGQDIWQRVFTARNDKVASWGGTVAGTYCLVYALAGAVIGTAAKVLYPNLANADDAFATIVKDELPIGVRGLVLAAALAAVMSTSSGALIACATVANNDIWSRLRRRRHRTADAGRPERRRRGQGQPHLHPGHGRRVIGIADRAEQRRRGADRRLQPARRRPARADPRRAAVEARHRRTARSPPWSSAVSRSIGLMATYGILANEPIYYGLLASLVAYVVVSLATKPTDAASWPPGASASRAGRSRVRRAAGRRDVGPGAPPERRIQSNDCEHTR